MKCQRELAGTTDVPRSDTGSAWIYRVIGKARLCKVCKMFGEKWVLGLELSNLLPPHLDNFSIFSALFKYNIYLQVQGYFLKLYIIAMGATNSTPSIDIPSVEIHDIETALEKRPRTLKHLIRANHVNHA